MGKQSQGNPEAQASGAANEQKKQMTAVERYEKVLEIYEKLEAKLAAGQEKTEEDGKDSKKKYSCKAPSCKCALHMVLWAHAVAATVMFFIFVFADADVVDVISMSVLWIVSLLVSLSVVSKVHAAKMEMYRHCVERKEKDEDARRSRLFKYLDEAFAACWKETEPKKEEPNPAPPTKPEKSKE